MLRLNAAAAFCQQTVNPLKRISLRTFSCSETQTCFIETNLVLKSGEVPRAQPSLCLPTPRLSFPAPSSPAVYYVAPCLMQSRGRLAEVAVCPSPETADLNTLSPTSSFSGSSVAYSLPISQTDYSLLSCTPLSLPPLIPPSVPLSPGPRVTVV
ncbi:hypothetical protein PAMP_018794 [Pampus punctatissimus]